MLAAVSAACRERPRPGISPSIRSLRRRAACLAAELSLRHWLDQHQLPYDLRFETPLTAPEHSQLYLGGRRALLHIILPHSAAAVQRLRHQPSRLLAATLPRTDLQPDGLPSAPQDLLIFGALIGFSAPHAPVDPRPSRSSPLTVYLASPPEWFRIPLGRCPTVEIIHDGQDRVNLRVIAWLGSKPVTRRLTLRPQQPFVLSGELGNVLWLQSARLPDGLLQFACPSLLRWKLSPRRWHALPIHPAEVLLVGWCTRRELEARMRQALLSAQPARWRALRPLAELAARLHQA